MPENSGSVDLTEGKWKLNIKVIFENSQKRLWEGTTLKEDSWDIRKDYGF